MKKIFLISLIILTSVLYAEEVLFFKGIMSNLDIDKKTGEKLKTEDTSISSQVTYVNNKYSGEDTVVIAHSQGGVRALGYAGKAKSNVKALITIGSPVKGYSPLLVGPNTLMKRIDGVIGDLSGGMIALVSGGYLGGVKLNSNNAFGILDAIGFEHELLSGIKTGEIFEKVGIKDLTPTSPYFKSYVNPNRTTSINKKIIKYPKKLVMKIKYKKRGWFRIPVISYSWIYGYKWIYWPSTKVENRISSSTAVGFIIGTQNDPLEFLDGNDKKKAKEITKNLGTAFDVGNVAFNALGVVTWGEFWNNRSRNFFRSAKACRDAKRLVKDPEKILGDIFGSTSNDSFILESDQKRSLSGLGGKTIKSDGEYYRRVKANHIQEMDNDEIWGAGSKYSLSKGAFTSKSIIGTWLSSRRITSKTTGTVVE